MSQIKTQMNEIKSKLRSLYIKNRTIDVIIGLNVIVVLLFILNIILSTIELSGFNSMLERTILYYVGIGLMLVAFIWFIFYPVLKSLKSVSKKEQKRLAADVGIYYPDIGDKIVNALDLEEDGSNKYSRTLIYAAVESVSNESKSINFNKVSSYYKTSPFFIVSAITILITVFLFFISPGLRVASYRILNHTHEFYQPPGVLFFISPGNVLVEKNDDIKIKVEVVGEKQETINLLTKTIDEPEFIKQTIFPDTSGEFILQLRSVKKSFQYFAESNEIMSETYSVEVIEKPIISKLNLDITPPRYSGEKPYSQKDNGNIIALVGTEVKLQATSNKNLNSGYIQFNDSLEQKLLITQQQATTSFGIDKSKDYFITISDSTNTKNKNPITYSIIAINDEYPSLTITKPETSTKLTKLEQVLVEIKMSDDYGFDKLVLHHRLSQSSFEKPSEEFSSEIIEFDKHQREQEVYYVWDVSELILAAGDVVLFYLEVFDNDYVGGPKSTKSQILTLYVPTLEELYKESEVAQEETMAEIEEVLIESEKLREELEKLSNELKADESKINWEEKKKIEDAAHKFEELKSKIEKARNKLSESKNELEKNDLLSQETLEKYLELQKLMDEMNSEEMNLAMKKLQEQLSSMNREQAQNNLEKIQFDEKSFQKSLERTMNLLKRIQIEQKMDEVVKRSEEVKDQIKKLEQETNDSDISNKEKSEDLSKKQNNITKKLDNLQKEMDKLQQKMSEFKDMPNEDMKDLQKQFEEQKNNQLSKEAKDQLLKQMKSEAIEQMQQLSKNMETTSEQMKNVQQQMQMQNQLQTMYDMMKAVNNLVELSKDQESLKNKSENSNSSQLLRDAPQQEEIMSGLEKTISQMQELSQKTFAITPEMGKALGQARAEMRNSMNAMQNENSNMAVLSQSGAMKRLNEAATMMKGKMDQMMNGGQGGGMMSMMQQMQQLSQQQMNLNKLTQQLNKGNLSQQQQQQVQRLSQEQEMIRKSLEQLNRENQEQGQSKKLTSNLENILDEMNEVIKRMNTENLNDDLVQSQEKILSKLLDAQRSINQRDFEENRESSEGSIYSRKSPEDIKFFEKKKDRIREELIKSIKEGYSHDYKEIIRKYYEALENEQNKTPINN